MTRRNTLQKSIILDTLTKLGNHPSADMVYSEINRVHPSISRATVFRNLHQMAEDGDIAKRYIPDGADRFDHLCTDHYHVKCIYCDSVMDVEMDYLTDLTDSVRSTNGFTLLDHNVVFSGICPACQKQQRKSKEK